MEIKIEETVEEVSKKNGDPKRFSCDIFIEGINVPKPDIIQLSFFIFLISILLIFKKSRFLLKKLLT